MFREARKQTNLTALSAVDRRRCLRRHKIALYHMTEINFYISWNSPPSHWSQLGLERTQKGSSCVPVVCCKVNCKHFSAKKWPRDNDWRSGKQYSEDYWLPCWFLPVTVHGWEMAKFNMGCGINHNCKGQEPASWKKNGVRIDLNYGEYNNDEYWRKIDHQS